MKEIKQTTTTTTNKQKTNDGRKWLGFHFQRSRNNLG